MKMEKIIWSEGMALMPQHFQQSDHYIEQQINQKSLCLNNYAWGFKSIHIDHNLLQMNKFSIEHCQGIFPDGTIIDAPHNDLTPKSLDINSNLTNKIVYLAIPILKENNEQRYQVDIASINDLVTKHGEASEIEVGRLLPKLLLEDEDRSEYSCLAIAKIKEASENQGIILDHKFIPPYINLKNSEILKKLFFDTLNIIKHRCDVIAQRLTNPEQAASSEIIDFLILQLFNKHRAALSYFEQCYYLHPQSFYKQLCELIGELATFTTNERRIDGFAAYSHHDLMDTFEAIIKQLKTLLNTVLEQNAKQLTVEYQNYGIWTSQIDDYDLLDSSQYILSIAADTSQENIKENMPNQIKIAAIEDIKNYISRAIPGIDIEPLTMVPRQIPFQANCCYFTLNKNSPIWQSLHNSAGIAFHISGNFINLQLELWALRG